jgi:hypothetical protein
MMMMMMIWLFGALVGILPTMQEVAGSSPAQYKDLYAWKCMFVLGLDVKYLCIYKKSIKVSINVPTAGAQAFLIDYT